MLMVIAIVFCAVVAFLVVLFVVFVRQEQQREQLNEAYRVVAYRRDGSLTTDDSASRPSVQFRYGKTRVLLDIYATGREQVEYFTQLHCGWPEEHLRLEVFPARWIGSPLNSLERHLIGKLRGAQDILIGSPEFDRDYIIRGNDEKRIAALLTRPVQASINNLRQFLGNDDIYVGAKANTLLIKKRSLICKASTLDRFVTLGLAFYDEIVGLREDGIEIVDQRESAFSLHTSHPICQICGETITTDAVLCRSCQTPHHSDCWLYCGVCSTYGCGERHFTKSHT